MKFHKKESSILEFKKTIPRNDQIVKTAVAFANSLGGKIIIGVDNDRNIVGVNEDKTDDMLEFLDKMIFESCNPKIIPNIHLQRFEDRIIIIIEISTGINRPYYIKSLGIDNGVFIRVGRSTVKADYEIIQELQWKNRGISFDCIPEYQIPYSKISNDLFLNFLKNRKIGYKKREIDLNLLKNYKTIIEDERQNVPTKGGLLLFSKKPQEYFSEAFIICSQFKGISGRDIISTIDCMGDLFEQFETAWEFITSKIPTSYEKIEKKRIEESEIPLVAIREILINAIVHRDYRISASIKVAIYQNRIEIFSPGTFPGAINIDHIGNGVTYIRNQMITKCFRETGYIEKLGSGFKIMLESYKEKNLLSPTVYEGDGFIKVILPRDKACLKAENINLKNDILKIFDLFKEVSISDIIAHSSISRATIGRKLRELLNAGKINKTGQGKNTKYFLKK